MEGLIFYVVVVGPVALALVGLHLRDRRRAAKQGKSVPRFPTVAPSSFFQELQERREARMQAWLDTLSWHADRVVECSIEGRENALRVACKHLAEHCGADLRVESRQAEIVAQSLNFIRSTKRMDTLASRAALVADNINELERSSRLTSAHIDRLRAGSQQVISAACLALHLARLNKQVEKANAAKTDKTRLKYLAEARDLWTAAKHDHLLDQDARSTLKAWGACLPKPSELPSAAAKAPIARPTGPQSNG